MFCKSKRLFGGIGQPAGGITPATEEEAAAGKRHLDGEKPEPHPVVVRGRKVADALEGFRDKCAPAAELEKRAPFHRELDRPYHRGAAMLALRPLRMRVPHTRRPACRPRGRRVRRTSRATRAGPSGDEPGSSEPPGLAGRHPADRPIGSTARAAA